MEELADKFLLSVDSGFGSKLAAEKLAVIAWDTAGQDSRRCFCIEAEIEAEVVAVAGIEENLALEVGRVPSPEYTVRIS